MIIKPKVRGNGGKLAHYLLADKKNDRAELMEMRGFHVPTLKGALQMEEEIAQTATHCKNPFYHVSFRAAEGETLTPEQWRQCADRLEQALGLEGRSRALVMHTHKGEQHLHAVWSRIDEQTMTAVHLRQDWPRCQKVARELEREFGLRQVRDHAPERERKARTFKEEQQERRTGKNLERTQAAIREAWEHSDDGKSLVAALEERGLALAKGDRRDFVAVDEHGGVHSIGKRATGARAAEVRARLADLDRDALPSVEQVREKAQALERQREERAEQEREKAPEHAAEKERAEERNPQKIERFLKRQDEIKAELLKRQEAAREAMKERMRRRDEKLEAWFKAKGKRLEEKLVAQQLTRPGPKGEERRALEDKWQRERLERQKESLSQNLGKIKAIRAVENASRLELQEVRHAEQRARLEIKQAEIRERYGIPAPDRDEAARQIATETRQMSFAKAEREVDGMTLKAKADEIKREAEERRQARQQERAEERKREAEERKQEREREREERAEKRRLWEEERKLREERAEQRKREDEERQQTRERERGEREEQKRWKAEERKQERANQRENELAAQAPPVPDLVSGKKAERALGGLADGMAKALEGVLDFFVGPTKPPEPPRREEQEQEKIDWKRYLDDEDYRRERLAADAARRKREKERENEAGRTRERDR